MTAWLAKLRDLVDRQTIPAAMEEAGRLAASNKDLCRSSSDFLALAARVCLASRQWWMAGFLANKALAVDEFVFPESREWSSSISGFTEGYYLVMRGELTLEKLDSILSRFASAEKVSAEYKRQFLVLISGYMHLGDSVKATVLEHLQQMYLAPSWSDRHSILSRIETLKTVRDIKEWVPQVDAGEIGNEARYANHADYPNALLAKRCYSNCESRVCGKCPMYPHLVSFRDIAAGDEITINYGSSYWTGIKPGTDPLLLGERIEEPFMDCIYFDGIVTDFACNPCPGGFLINPLDTDQKMIRNPNLKVTRVPEDHPAFPGFGLFASQAIAKGSIIAIYGGIVDASPFSGRHQSKYAVDLTDDPGIGPFGFSFDPKTLTIMPVQKYLPFLTDFPDISIPRNQTENYPLAGLTRIAGLDESLTRTICDAVMIPMFRPVVQSRLKQIKVPFDNGNKRDSADWARAVKKAFGDIFSKPPPPPASLKRSLTPEPELVIDLDSD